MIVMVVMLLMLLMLLLAAVVTVAVAVVVSAVPALKMFKYCFKAKRFGVRPGDSKPNTQSNLNTCHPCSNCQIHIIREDSHKYLLIVTPCFPQIDSSRQDCNLASPDHS